MSDVNEFLDDYQKTLDHTVEYSGWPDEILALYSFESCLKHDIGKEVYLVRDKRTGGKAILRITSQDSGDRADAEWAILSKLDHTGIPKTYGRMVSGDKSYIVREFIPGYSIDVAVSQRPLTLQDIYSFARKICDILDYLHRQTPPVIHRDIKPQNIILRPDGTIVLTDFGIARVFNPNADSDTQYVGTMPYAPPEQYGYAQSTPQSDIYALGILFIYLATGSPDRRGLEERIKNKRLLALINRCVAFDPADRFSSIDEVRRFIDGERRVKPGLILGIAAALVCVILATGLFVVFDPTELFAGLRNPPAVNQATPDNASSEDQGATDPGDNPDGLPGGTGSNAGSQGAPASQNSDGALFDSSVTGNLPGNINNGGFAVEGNGETYISLDSGIHVLEADGTLGRQVVDTVRVKSMNFHQGKLYFSSPTPGIKCADPATGEVTKLNEVSIGKIYIDEGILYFENAEDHLNLYTIGFDGSGMRKISDYGSVYYRNVHGGYQYFANTNDEETLYRANLETGAEEKLYNIRSAWISIYGETIYFSDFSIPGAFVSMDLDGSNTEVLFVGSYSFINATPRGVFFTNPEAQQLEVMTLDGKSRTLLTKKKCKHFVVTSDWIIYEDKDDDDAYWIMRLDGSDDQPLPVDQ